MSSFKKLSLQKIWTCIGIACIAGVIWYYSSIQAIYAYYERYGISSLEKKSSMNLKLQICNKTEKKIEHLSIVMWPDFWNIDAMKCSDFQEAQWLYKIIPFSITNYTPEGIRERYESIPIDYFGESLLEAGSYTLNINSLDDSPKNATLMHDNGVQYEIVQN